MNKFTVIMAAIVIGFVAVVFMVREDTDRVEADPSEHIVGEGTSGVTLIEYGDFQCPACAEYFPLIDTVKDIYGDEISFQFRHYSLFGSFPNSMAAHLAAEAAGQQDRFFEMHDLIYERQANWSEMNDVQETFDGYAEELELDMEQFREDYSDPKTRAVVMADLERGNAQGVTGTPTFFINEERVENPTSAEEFFEIIDEYIENETGAPSQNSPFTQEGEFDEDILDQEQPDLPPEFDVDEAIEGAPRTEEEQ